MNFMVGDNVIRIVSEGVFTTKHQFKMGGRFISVPCTGENCKQCEKGMDAKILYAWVVLDRVNAKVSYLEVGKKVGDAICELGRHEDLRTFDINVNRKGKTKEDTVYEITKIVKSQAITDKEKSMVKAKMTRLINKYLKE